METKVFKGYKGYEAISEIPLPGVKMESGLIREGGMPTLRVTTYKASGGRLVTSASVVLCADGAFSFVLFRDFSKTLRIGTGRCTEKTVREEHAAALSSIAAVEAEARAFYAAKEAA